MADTDYKAAIKTIRNVESSLVTLPDWEKLTPELITQLSELMHAAGNLFTTLNYKLKLQ